MPFPHLQQQLLRRFKKETFITRGRDRRSLAGSSRSSTTLEYAKKAAPLSPFPERSAGAGGARRLAVSRKGLAFPPPFPDRGFGSLPFSAVKPAPAGPRRSRLPPMGSSGSKNAAAGGAMRRERRARSLGARVLRPACFRRPKASGNDGNGKDVRQAKEIGCSEKSDKSQEDLHDDRCTNSKQSGLLALCDSEVRLDGDKKESNSTGLFESRTNSTNQASTLFSKHFNSCFGLYNKCTEVKLEGHSNPTSSNHAHPVAQSNSTPLSEMRSCLDQAFDSSSDVTTEHDSINVTNAASIDAPAGSIDCDENDCHINTSAVGSIERKPSQRRQEPLEGTARFSRTRSVGRLRDRVLRRTSLPEARFGFLFTEESSAFSRQDSRRRLLDALANISYTDCENSNSQLVSSTHQFSGNSNSENRRNNEPETSELREIGGHGMEEHNSTFSERRRRIRSQVRALQRMGSRFENISGHDRQCILSGQHRTGNCTCGTSSRSRSVPDQTSTRASISRIVMLAEALFEVLDEIHHQAVVLASRPSVTSVGSVPAPKEVVDRMPLRTYAKSHRRQSDENAQCYICLVEYEEGEAMRVLPCLHEFHRSCVDKWLKEIHRVCPVCRYDVCLSDGTRLDGLE